ncbi:MAG: lysylphosphatidylglycerol synthase domain-containing protein [Solirubrobacteraceae bacterium]
MRIALVSPYSWTYPGGVTRHIEALAGELIRGGHDVRVLAPYDPPGSLSARMHRGARPEERAAPDWLVPLGRTVGFPANGAVSNLATTPTAIARLRNELRTGGYDVAHIHEPVAPVVGYSALDTPGVPLVGTFHCYSENAISNGVGNVVAGTRRRLQRLHVRIAVSEAAAWTGRRFYGGEYRIIPNGVAVPAEIPLRAPRPEGAPLRLAFVGQAVERKGLPVLLRAYEALRDHIPVELVIVGAGPDDVAPILVDARGVTALGKVSDAEKAAALASADLMVAPSLGGESFGMVLTEAFAAGTPVVASDIAGYRDVVRDGVDGVLVPRADPAALAATLRDLALDPPRRAAMARAARAHAHRYAWPTVAGEVLGAYEDAVALPAPQGARERAGVFLGAIPADLGPRRPPERRLPSLEPRPASAPSRSRMALRRAGIGLAGAAAALLAVETLRRIGLDRIGASLLAATPIWVIVSLGLMCLSMAVRGAAWFAILRAALPAEAPLRRIDALQGTFIGVLMSATLPARLGEPSRALIVARRTGRPREHLPTVVGTIVSQTLLNVVALVILGIVMFSTVDLFSQKHSALVFFAMAPLALVAIVLAAPALLRGGLPSRSRRVQAFLQRARAAAAQVRAGLDVFRRPRLGAQAMVLQLLAWGVQWLSCWALLVALGLDDVAGIGAAAAVLFAVNVTAVLPATPSNLGVFQAACVAVLHGAYGVGSADALAFGIILQAVEIATAIVMGTPALLKEGLSWREVRLRAMNQGPVELDPLPAGTSRAKA